MRLGTPRKGDNLGMDPGGEGLPEGCFMQSAIEGDRLALSQPPRTSSHLLMAWRGHRHNLPPPRWGLGKKAEGTGKQGSPWFRRKWMHNTGLDGV